jgi:hypothetical protein
MSPFDAESNSALNGDTFIHGKTIGKISSEFFSSTLIAQEKDSFFTELFGRQWQSECDPKDDTISIDRNGKLFGYILEYFRTGALPNSVKNDDSLRQNLLVEADYFRLRNLQNVIKTNISGSTLLQSQKHKEILNEFYGNPINNGN